MNKKTEKIFVCQKYTNFSHKGLDICWHWQKLIFVKLTPTRQDRISYSSLIVIFAENEASIVL